MDLFGHLSSTVNSAFSTQNHGFLDGKWEDFQLSINRVFGIVPEVVKNNLKTYGEGIGSFSNSVLSSLSFQPSFWLLGIGGILVLIIGGYVTFKVLKYV